MPANDLRIVPTWTVVQYTRIRPADVRAGMGGMGELVSSGKFDSHPVSSCALSLTFSFYPLSMSYPYRRANRSPNLPNRPKKTGTVTSSDPISYRHHQILRTGKCANMATMGRDCVPPGAGSVCRMAGGSQKPALHRAPGPFTPPSSPPPVRLQGWSGWASLAMRVYSCVYRRTIKRRRLAPPDLLTPSS